MASSGAMTDMVVPRIVLTAGASPAKSAIKSASGTTPTTVHQLAPTCARAAMPIPTPSPTAPTASPRISISSSMSRAMRQGGQPMARSTANSLRRRRTMNLSRRRPFYDVHL